MNISRVGVDLAKNVFQLQGVDRHGKPVWKRKLSRDKWLSVLFETVKPGTEIGMEACSGAHHWSRILLSKGYPVKIIPPQHVKPFVKTNKNDANDALAICETMVRPKLYPVPVKTVEQQDLQAIHRVRSDIMSTRISKANQIRGLVSEYGLVAPQQFAALRRVIPRWLDDSDNGLTICFKQLLQGLWDDLILLEQRLDEMNKQITRYAQRDPVAKRLQKMNGVGPLIATAMVATLGDGKQYRKGRDMAAALGLTPKQYSSGGKERLLGISKRGDSYLRALLVHGARSTMIYAKNRQDRFSRWVVNLQSRRHPNVVAVAIANKMARTAWVLMTKEVEYDPNRGMESANC